MTDGRRGIFEDLVRATSARVHNLAYRMLGNRADAEDATQEAFLRIWESLDRRDPDRPIEPWARAVAVRVFLNRIRGAKRRARHEAAATPRPATAPTEDTVERREEESAVEEAMGALAGADRAVLALHYYDGRTQAEIADVFEVPRTTVQSRLSRALDALRASLRSRGHLAVVAGVEDVMRASPTVGPPAALEASLLEIGIGGVGAAGTGALTIGGMVMSKATAVVIVAVLLVIGGGGGFVAGRATAPAESSAAEGASARQTADAGMQDAPATAGLAASRSGKAAGTSEALRGGSQAAASESATDMSSRSGSAPSGDAAAPPAATESATAIDWAAFGKLLAKNLDALDRVRAFSEENEQAAVDGRQVAPLPSGDQAAVMELFAQFARACELARILSTRPVFDERVLPGLVDALFGETLGLSSERRAALDKSARDALRDTLRTIDPAAAAPVALFSARRGLGRRVVDSATEGLPAEPAARAKKLEPMVEAMLEGDHKLVRVGGGDAAARSARVLKEWEETYHLDAAQKDALRATAERYVREATDVLVRRGIDGAGKKPDAAARDAAEAEMLPLLLVAERDVEAHVTDAQRRIARANPPTIVFVQSDDSETTSVSAGGL